MKRSMVCALCLVLMLGFLTAGCEDEGTEGAVKAMDEYRETATQEIDETNADAELDKLEKEIEADTE